MDKQERDKRYCIAYWCLNADKKNPELSFFSLPSSSARRQKWLKLLGRQDLITRANLKYRSYFVCSDHFKPSDIKLIRQLKSHAYPKEISAEKQPKKTAFEKCDSPETSSTGEVTKRLDNLIDWLNVLENKKRFAFDLLIYSPHAYQCLKTVLNLPSEQVVLNYKLNIPPGLDDKLLQRFQIKLKSLPYSAKFCMLCIDKFLLKSILYYDTRGDEITGFHCINDRKKTEIAKYAYVIMIQGLYYDWKQPIAYVLLGDDDCYADLDLWLNNVICKLTEFKIEIKAITSDDSSYFRKFAKDVKLVSEQNQVILYNEIPIHYVFDVPNLFLSLRNYLLTNDLCIGDQKISWKYIKEVCEHDIQKESNQRLLPKITKSHIEPNNKEKSNIRFAVETFSRILSTTLHAYIDFGQMSEDARPTANFIETLNDLYDILNPKNIKSENSNLTMNENQKNIINQAMEMLEAVMSTTRVETIENFLISIKSIKMLSEKLLKDGLPYLSPRQLNKGCLRTFYKNLASKRTGNLTPIQFRRGFSTMCVKYLVKPLSPAVSSGLDLYDSLSKVGDINKFTTAPERSLNETKPEKSAVALGREIDYQIELPELNTLVYVFAYLLYKCIRKHKCLNSNRFWIACRNLSGSNLFNQNLHETCQFYESLKIPPKEFVQYIQNLESTITQNFYRLIKKSPGSQLFRILETVPAKVPCSCFPLSYLLKLFIRLRIYNTLKFNNIGKNKDKKYLKIKHL